jgi:hypothetical protein
MLPTTSTSGCTRGLLSHCIEGPVPGVDPALAYPIIPSIARLGSRRLRLARPASRGSARASTTRPLSAPVARRRVRPGHNERLSKRKLWPFTAWVGFTCIILSADEGTHANIARATESEREAERRGLRSFTVGVSEDDLHVIAKHGYGGALSTEQDQQAQGRLSNAVARRRFALDGN